MTCKFASLTNTRFSSSCTLAGFPDEECFPIKLIASVTLASIALAFSFNYPWVSITMILVSFVMYFLPPDAPEYTDDATEKK